MTVPTPPAVSDAMREAVVRDDAREKRLADIVDRYVTDCTLVHRTLTEEDVWLLEGLAFGPIASEIARLTGERDAAVANAREPVGDVWDLVRHMEEQCRAFIREKDEWRTAALAAEAETARLRAALEDAADALGWGATALREDENDAAAGVTRSAANKASAALTSQEKTDV